LTGPARGRRKCAAGGKPRSRVRGQVVPVRAQGFRIKKRGLAEGIEMPGAGGGSLKRSGTPTRTPDQEGEEKTRTNVVLEGPTVVNPCKSKNRRSWWRSKIRV